MIILIYAAKAIDKVQHTFKKKNFPPNGYRENIPKHKGHITETHS